MEIHMISQAQYSLKYTLAYIFHLIAKAFFIAVFVMLFFISSLFLLVIGDRFVNPNKNSNPLYGGFIIVSNSMVPTININDAVLVKRVENRDLSIGDIITFRSASNLYKGVTITHRVVGMQKVSDGSTVYRTKGDNNLREDSAIVKEKSIYGKVILKVPKIGLLQQILKSKIGFFLLIFLPIIFVIALNGFNIYLKRDKMKNSI